MRTRRARSRGKQAGRSRANYRSLAQHPTIRVLIGTALWLAVSAIVDAARTQPRRGGDLWPALASGDAGLLLAGLAAVALGVWAVRPTLLRSTWTTLLAATTALVGVVVVRLAVAVALSSRAIRPDLTELLAPVTVSALLGTLLIDSFAGLSIGMWVALVHAAFLGRSLEGLLLGMLAVAAAAVCAGRARTRTKVVQSGIFAGAVQLAGVLAMDVSRHATLTPALVGSQVAACLGVGFAAAIIALVLLPVFEAAFGRSTDITLLEISDLGHPLLQRLALEAPGTYHHSLVVANLAQAAADEIGANSLLTRVGAYFHDVGKLTKPEFYSENIPMQRNPHDELSPNMSALVITAHVKEGVTLASVYKLPRQIRQAIEEHHGTSLISWFHHKARSMQHAEPESATVTIDEESFRYPGPKPTSRESAIISLADPIEAASRSLEKATPGHVESLVNNVIQGRVVDGQLDQCDLTLAELARIRTTFIFALSNMLHARVPYHRDEDRHHKRPTLASGQPAGGPGLDLLSDVASG